MKWMKKMAPLALAITLAAGAMVAPSTANAGETMTPVFDSHGLLIGFLFCSNGRCIYQPF